jgi:hypothetical protein
VLWIYRNLKCSGISCFCGMRDLHAAWRNVLFFGKVTRMSVQVMPSEHVEAS